MANAEPKPTAPETGGLAKSLFSRIAGADDADPQEARNGLRIAGSLSLTKVSDGLIDPKLVLSWLMTALGAPAALAAALVPIREAGALLPQVFYAGLVDRTRHRKWIWTAGSVGQGLSALGIAAAGLLMEGTAAGLTICVLLALLAVSRAACSVSTKDVLGRTVEKHRRGAITGLAGSVASIGVVIFALLLASGLLQDKAPVLIAIALAGVFWLAASVIFSTIEEPKADVDESAGFPPVLSVLKNDATLRRFILVRGLLVSTALAPPWIVVISGEGGDNLLTSLGALVLASAAASFVSSFVWGRLSDKSSRTVLALAGGIAAFSLVAMLVLSGAGLATTAWAGPAVLFVLMLAYHGVRQGRSTYLVDMSPEEDRATYSAVANLTIGLILLAVGAFGGGLGSVGAIWAIGGFAAMAAAGGALAMTLREVEQSQ